MDMQGEHVSEFLPTPYCYYPRNLYIILIRVHFICTFVRILLRNWHNSNVSNNILLRDRNILQVSLDLGEGKEAYIKSCPLHCLELRQTFVFQFKNLQNNSHDNPLHKKQEMFCVINWVGGKTYSICNSWDLVQFFVVSMSPFLGYHHLMDSQIQHRMFPTLKGSKYLFQAKGVRYCISLAVRDDIKCAGITGPMLLPSALGPVPLCVGQTEHGPWSENSSPHLP